MDAAKSPARRAGSVRDELAALWRLALPLAMAQAGQALMGMVDTAVLGRLSAAAQGGAGLGNSITFTLSFFGMGVMMALDPLVSQAVGAGDLHRARSVYWQGVWLALSSSVLVVIAVAFAPLALPAFGVKATLVAGASDYMAWRLPGVPGLLLFVGARSYLQGVGRTQPIVVTTIVANVVNLLLDLLLVFGWGPVPAMGLAGAALGTSIGSWLQFGLLALMLGRSPGSVQRAPRARDLKLAAKLGLPIGAHLLAEAGLFMLAGVLAGRLGEAATAAHHVALSWASFSFCVAVGIGSAATVRVGWGVGAGDTPAARRSGLVAFANAAGFMALAALFFLLLPHPLARAMSDKPEVIDVAVALFAIVAVFQVSDGIQAVGAGVLRGAGDTRFTFWANILGHWAIGLPVAYVLGVRGTLGVIGLWWGLSAGLTAVAVALLSRFWWLSRRPIRAL